METLAKVGGAPVDQLVIMAAYVWGAIALISVLALGRKGGPLEHRMPVQQWGRRTVLGLPAWAAIPTAVSFVSMLVTAFGTHWDIALHLDRGRDPGPLGNPSHYWQLGGLVGCFAAGWLAMVMAPDRPGPAPVRITRTWRVPIGGLIMAIFGVNVLVMFPIDDVWHRTFGEDITLWSPTHWAIMFGGPWTFFGQLVLLAEGHWAMSQRSDRPRPAGLRGLASVRVQTALVAGMLLYMFPMFMSEWDHGIAQYPLTEHPLVLAAGATLCLVIARAIGGRGAALGAVATYLVVRGIFTAIVAGPLGPLSAQDLPLLIPEAIIVEALAVWLGTRRPFRFALASGLAIGTLGFAAEGVWSQFGLPWGWPVHMVVGAMPWVVAGSLGAGLLGALVAAGLRGEVRLVEGRRGIALAAAGLLLPVSAGAILGQTHAPDAKIAATLTPADPPRPPKRDGERWVNADIQVKPASTVRDADWFHTLAWNGHEPLVLDGMQRVGPDTWRTTKPIPVSPPWKAMVRMNRGHAMGAVPIFMPASKELGAKEVPAARRFERAFIPDMSLLQRERDRDPPMWLWHGASAVFFAWMFFLFGLCAVLLRRFARGTRAGESAHVRPSAPSAERRPQPESTPVAVG